MQLLEKAVMCYAQMGVERAGHGDVAKLASVSTATVFNYFPTREALTEAVLLEIRGIFDHIFDNYPAESKSAAEQVQEMADAYDDLVEEYPDLIKVLLNWSASFGPDVRPQYLEFQDHVLDGIHKRLPKPKEDRTEARIILAAAYSYARMKFDNTSGDVLNRFVVRIVQAIA